MGSIFWVIIVSTGVIGVLVCWGAGDDVFHFLHIFYTSQKDMPGWVLFPSFNAFYFYAKVGRELRWPWVFLCIGRACMCVCVFIFRCLYILWVGGGERRRLFMWGSRICGFPWESN